MKDLELHNYSNRIYNKILTEVVEPLTGKNSTFLGDLNKVGKQLLGDKFHGVYSSDMIPKLTVDKPYAILNLDNSKQQGSHWIGIAKLPKGKNIIVYDSFGRKSKKIIKSIFKNGSGKIIDAEYDAEQGILEANCGARSLSFLLLFDKFGPKFAKLI